MAIIEKAPETMTSRRRVEKTLNFEKTDRVPIDYTTNPGVHERVKQALGAPDDETLRRALGVDFRSVHAQYRGPNRFPVLPDRQTDPVYGFNMRWVENRSGGYWDFCDFPLQGADPETIAAFPVPSADEFDYTHLDGYIQANRDYALYAGSAGICDIINATGRVMGMEDALVNLLEEDEATLCYVRRRVGMEIGILERILSRHASAISFVKIGEDLGTQIAPMISLRLFRRVFRPLMQQYVDLASSYRLPVMVHTCGSSSWAYEDFIEMGIRAVDTLQPEAAQMDPATLKARFGGRLSFHGCISTAGPLAYGSPQEVNDVCRSTLEVMMPGGGYHFAPTHAIQDNTPTENVLAMYQAAHTYGRYQA